MTVALLPSVLALGAAVTYGAADFLGGLAARRTSTVAVVFVSQLSGLVALVVGLPLLPAATPAPADLAWGGAAGLVVAAGIGLLYRALAVGRMTVVAPTTAVCAVAIPVLAAMLLGERPPSRALLGIALAVVAIVLVSRSPARGVPAGPSGIGLALASGVGIGLFLLFLSRAAPDAGLWPLLVARSTTLAVFGVAAVAGRRSLRMAAPVAGLAIAAGVLDMAANALYLLAAYRGPLSVVATLSSLYPATTVLLALVLLAERLSGWQTAGLGCALAAVLLIVGR